MQFSGAKEGSDPIALAESRFHAANMLRERGALREAETVYRAAIALWPEFLEALNNLGLVLRSQGKIEEAIGCYEAAIAIDPKCPEPHMNLGLAHLLRGDFTEGWPEYEWRLRMPNSKLRRPEKPMWDGKPLDGKRILIHPDQGFGDTIHFARYAKLVKERGGRVILECQAPLARLLRSLEGVEQIVAVGEALPDYDCHAPLLSLPYLFGTTIANVPASQRYLAPPADLAEAWRQRLGNARGFRVGICWQGNPGHPEFVRRSAPLSMFQQLAEIPGVQLFSLQKGPGSLRQGKERPQFPLTDLDPEIGDFADTAAAMAQMDLVVTTDSSVAHLAGAVGKPCWMFLQYAADWRWMLERNDTPWYASLRLFRQEKAGDWTSPFRRIREALPESMFARANALLAEGRREEAADLFAHVAQVRPDAAAARLNLGVSLKEANRLEEAERELAQAARLAPHSAESWNSLGNAQFNLRKYAEAGKSFSEAIRLQPRFAEAHVNLGTLRLALGDFERGWEEYAWRLELGEHASRRFAQPLWDGSPIAGKTILLYAEQGFGDSIQFIRYAPLVAASGARVLVECQKPLKSLFAESFGADSVFARGEPLPAFDLRAPLLHLPLLFGAKIGNIPTAASYLRTDAGRAYRWSEKLASIREEKVGICWASNPKHPSSARKSIPEALAKELIHRGGSRFFDLTQLPSPEIPDFAEAAAAISCLDLVISVDTAIGHLAAALGRPTWMLLPYSAEWRWLTERADSPWYPTMRLFRQSAPGSWEEPLQKISQLLAI